MSRGILAWSGYLPRLRMARSVIAQQLDWHDQGVGRARGHRSMGNWDEDAITMAVAAGQQLLKHTDQTPHSAILASTTAPFLDRSNAGLMSEALGLPSDLNTQDVGGSQRAATSAAMAALESTSCSLLAAADRRPAQPGSGAEWRYGDGAAALLLGSGPLAAEYLGGRSANQDFIDHYRSQESGTDYELEDRWVRESGVLSLVPDLLSRGAQDAGLELKGLTHFVLPLPTHHARKVVAKLGLPAQVLADNLHHEVGETGAGHSLLMLANVLDQALPDQIIALVGFGQGADVLFFRTTGAVNRRDEHRLTVTRQIQRATEVTHYLKLPAFNRQIALHRGIRGEADKRTAISAYFRKKSAVNAMLGTCCDACGTPHFPPARICVNCGAVDQMSDYGFSSRVARVKSFTEDWQSATVAPPLCYGNIEFEGGGNAFLEITDVSAGQLSVGTKLEMQFRVKDFDEQRGFRRYFWKPRPVITNG